MVAYALNIFNFTPIQSVNTRQLTKPFKKQQEMCSKIITSTKMVYKIRNNERKKHESSFTHHKARRATSVVKGTAAEEPLTHNARFRMKKIPNTILKKKYAICKI